MIEIQQRAVELRGIEKSFRSPVGPVHAVRGVDVAVAPGEVVALLGPNGAGKSTTIDVLLGLIEGRRGHRHASSGGRPPRRSRHGLVGAMLQTGSLLRDLSVRELVTVIASLYPTPLDVDEVLELVGITGLAERRTQKLSGGETQRVALRTRARDATRSCSCSTSRRRRWTSRAVTRSGRRCARSPRSGKTVLFATHYLEEADAYADRAVLMARGRVVVDGPTTEIKAMVGLRTIRATLPGADLDVLARLPGVSSAERRGEAVVLRCTDSDAAIRALLERFPRARDIEITGAGFEEAFLELTRDHDQEEAA